MSPERFLRRGFPAVLVLLGGLGLTAMACSSHPPRAQGANDAGGDDGASDGGSEGPDDAEAAAPTQAFLRIAQVSPDMPPIDVCVAVHGTGTFQGPLIGQLAAASAGDAGEDADAGAPEGDAGAPGVAYAQVSAYLPLDPGQYDVRLVPAGASSCSPVVVEAGAPGVDGGDAGDAGGPGDGGAVSDGGVPDATDLPALAVGEYATLLIAGDLTPAAGDPGATVAILPDDSVLTGGAASLRAINAIPSAPSLDFGVGSTTQWMPLLVDVQFAAASNQVYLHDGVVDPNGYVFIAPFASTQAMSARVSSSDAATDVATASSVTIPLGSIATVLAIGGKTGDATHPPALLLCTDNQPSGGLLADCSIAQ